MYKLIYWSKKKNRLVVIIFVNAKDCVDYFYRELEDIELDDHFAKIVKE